MIPPCDPSILESNPQFKKLYQNLTTSILNPDGSTRAQDAEPERKGAVEELRKCRVRNAKKQIKKGMLRRLAFEADSGLEDENRDNVGVISLYLDSTLTEKPSGTENGNENEEDKGTDDILTLLAPDIEKFYTVIPDIVPPFSSLLSSTVANLRNIANAGATNPSPAPATEPPLSRFRARQSLSKLNATPLLSKELGDRVKKLREIQLVELPAARREMAITAAAVLALRGQILEKTVELLERAKHGALARATKAKAEHLSAVARGVDRKLNVTKLTIHNEIHTPEAIAALGNYRKHLQDIQEKLKQREVRAIEELKNYDAYYPGADADSKQKGNTEIGSGELFEIARRYGQLMIEVDAVKGEIGRLERG
ncbi:hypothetical protein PHISCL_06116 [Aspergillus sclerotialis]|uniref:Uncharacterized protein n=1 Tax=Aspergillus sclerotialis TaxID=2070753 RepID=A0A3A2ZQB1_9EURO|nr:hypothetical protein PHISCL_06116 [Aspergillus sclerotialis]